MASSPGLSLIWKEFEAIAMRLDFPVGRLSV